MSDEAIALVQLLCVSVAVGCAFYLGVNLSATWTADLAPLALPCGSVVGQRLRMTGPKCLRCGTEMEAFRELSQGPYDEMPYWVCLPCGERWNLKAPSGHPGSLAHHAARMDEQP